MHKNSSTKDRESDISENTDEMKFELKEVQQKVSSCSEVSTNLKGLSFVTLSKGNGAKKLDENYMNRLNTKAIRGNLFCRLMLVDK